MSNRNKPQRHSQGQQEPVPQQIVHQQSFYKGIIPRPEDLEAYERISPGFANRIIKITEDEASHRRQVENNVIKLGSRSIVLGQILGFLAVALVSGLCYLFMVNGAAREGAWVAGGVLVSVASVFLLRRKG